MTKKKKEKKINIKLYIGIAVSIFIFALTPYIINFNNYSFSTSSADWATFGDYMGGTVNPFLAFLSFIALLYTIKLQSEELKASRKELKKSSKALKEQSKSIKIQNFENTFFNMVKLHNDIVDNIKIKGEQRLTIKNNYKKVTLTNPSNNNSKSVYTGREAITMIYNCIIRFTDSSNRIIKFNKLYDLCLDEYSNCIGHYFGNIYQILKLIYVNHYIKDKRKYSDLFRAQFSAYELNLLFLHCTGEIGSRIFKKYIEEFNFFEHLKINLYSNFNTFIIDRSIYDLNAFGRNKKNIEKYIQEVKKKRKIELQNLENKSYSCLQLVVMYFENEEYDKAMEQLNKLMEQDKNLIDNLRLFNILKREIEEEKNRKAISLTQ